MVEASADVDDGAGLGAVARFPVDAGDAAGAELHERAHDDARDHGVAIEPAVQRAPDADLSGAAIRVGTCCGNSAARLIQVQLRVRETPVFCAGQRPRTGHRLVSHRRWFHQPGRPRGAAQLPLTI